MFNAVDEEESYYTAFTFNDGYTDTLSNAGGYFNDLLTGTKIPGLDYFSPWDIWFSRNPDYVESQPTYLFINGNPDPEANSFSPYDLVVTPYVGLAYFDGLQDGVFNDLYLSTNGLPNSSFTFLGNPNYSNLYQNNNEVGELFPLQQIVIPAHASAWMESDNLHLPLNFSSRTFSNNMVGNFDFIPGLLTPDEESLLANYGKVFFYEVEVYENGSFIERFSLYPNVHNLHGPVPSNSPTNASWEFVPDLNNNNSQAIYPPLGSNHDLRFYTVGNNIQDSRYSANLSAGGNFCNSHEVVFDVIGTVPYTHTITAGSVPLKVTMYFQQHPFKFWASSSLVLLVHN